MEKRIFSIIFKLLVVVLGIIGISLNLKGLGNLISTFSYYTIQSNVACVILFFVLAIAECKKYTKSNKYYLFKSMFTMCIMVTFAVFQFVLRPQFTGMEGGYNPNSINDWLVHGIVPILVLLDYFIFDVKGKFKWFYPLLWAIMPLLYPLYVVIYNLLGGKFLVYGGASADVPYFFMNVAELGWGKAILYCSIILVVFLVFAYIYYAIDKLMANIQNNPKNK